MPILQERLLLQELNHRISNEFTSAIDVMSRAAARSNNKEVKAALADATELMHHYADVHHALRMPEHDGRMDAAASLRKLCLSISRSKLDRMKIELVLVASRLRLQSDRCWLLGMIVYELITNAARHAFAGGNGRIRVELWRAGTFVECRVLDNGFGPESIFTRDTGSKSWMNLPKLSMDDSTKSLELGDRHRSWCSLSAENRKYPQTEESKTECWWRTAMWPWISISINLFQFLKQPT